MAAAGVTVEPYFPDLRLVVAGGGDPNLCQPIGRPARDHTHRVRFTGRAVARRSKREFTGFVPDQELFALLPVVPLILCTLGPARGEL